MGAVTIGIVGVFDERVRAGLLCVLLAGRQSRPSDRRRGSCRAWSTILYVAGSAGSGVDRRAIAPTSVNRCPCPRFLVLSLASAAEPLISYLQHWRDFLSTT